MKWANPQALWLLLVLPPLLLAFFWWAGRQRQRLMRQFIQARLLPNLTTGISVPRARLRVGALTLAVVFLVLALARPQWGFNWEEVKQRGLDIVLAIDTSKSMLARDISPDRLDRAKLAALDLMRLAKSDRLGLIAFAGGAFLQCPLTFDDSAFRQSVESLDVNIIPQGGTALAEAIDTANDAFKEGENYKVLVLITDGEDHDSGAVEAARKAAAKGMDIFTIGVGTPAGELLQVTDANGNTDYIRDDQGNVVKSHLNEKLLREIAGATPKGFYLPMRGAKTMETLYEQGLAPIPKSESGDRLVRRYHERFQWPLGLALACLFFEMILPERGRRRRRAGSATEAVAAPVAAALALLAIAIPQDASASPSSAYKAYHAGKYDQALKDYEDALQKRKDDPRLHYDAGAAAYQTKKYDQAQKEFSQALDSPDWKLQGQAYYNLGNTLFHLGAQNQDPANRQRAWEESIQDFENTLKLNPQDPDAKYNRDTVKKLLEELKKQQQQQQQQQNQNNKNDKKDQKQDQKDQQNQNQNQQNKQNQSKQDQSKDNQQKQNQSSKQDQQSNPDKKQDQARNEQQRKKDEEKARQEAQKQEKPQGGEQKNGEQGQAYAAGEMTPQEAAQLLDAQKGHEMMMPIKPDVKRHPHAGPIKDW